MSVMVEPVGLVSAPVALNTKLVPALTQADCAPVALGLV